MFFYLDFWRIKRFCNREANNYGNTKTALNFKDEGKALRETGEMLKEAAKYNKGDNFKIFNI